MRRIGKKLRFEVFERDNFTCQYCGRSAPDTVLHVDHIRPVSQGGGDDIANLITSCMACNLGKSDHVLFGDEPETMTGLQQAWRDRDALPKEMPLTCLLLFAVAILLIIVSCWYF